jgi:hypothetical protein
MKHFVVPKKDILREVKILFSINTTKLARGIVSLRITVGCPTLISTQPPVCIRLLTVSCSILLYSGVSLSRQKGVDLNRGK